MSKTGSSKSKVKIFVGYYQPNTIFQSNVYQPIITSNIPWEEQQNIQRDNTGINIADRNKHYGELSGHYWVWKNYIPTCDAEYIGYCHYRRFLDFGFTETEGLPFKPTDIDEFKETFKNYSEENILQKIDKYDIVLPQKFLFNGRVYDQYTKFHPQEDMNIALNILGENYPEYAESAMKVMAEEELYTCMHFIMKKELFCQYQEWIFNILTRLEKKSDWSKYTDYYTIRTPAYIAERFFNIWLMYNIEKQGLKVLNTTSVLLVGEGYGELSPELYKDGYTALVKFFREQKRIK